MNAPVTMPAALPRLRPRAARWFEILVARDDATLALEALAATGAVELETRPGAELPTGFAELRPLLARYAELAQRYRAWWPQGALETSSFPEPPRQSLERSLAVIRAWAVEAEALIRALEQGRAEAADLQQWRAACARLAPGPIRLTQLAAAGPALQARLAVLPRADADSSAAPAEWPAGVLLHAYDTDTAHHWLALGPPAALLRLAQQVHARKGRWLTPPAALPDGLQADAQAQAAWLAARAEALALEQAQTQAALDRLTESHGLRRALGDASRLRWMLDNVRALESGPLFTWITGWTSAASADALEHAVEASGARALVRLRAAPPRLRSPMLLANPPWARPFEVFARALGMPAGDEADPSALLALTVPLMFGYMFGDVGQGLVIAAAGFALRRRFPIARLFIAGGLAAAAFGLLFGSVFSLHLLHPLWTAPLADPLAVLVVPLVGGAVLLSLGLLLSALQAHWRGEFARWLATDGGLLVGYLGLLGVLVWPAAGWLAAGGALWYCTGHVWQEGRVTHAPVAAGELLERLMQLLINTLSFARVGAFALAHAGLSSAIVALMAAADHPVAAALVLVAGNAVVMLLEGLVVSIQTTRLVLFEFFARFLSAQGRVFRPLPPPPSLNRPLVQETAS
jgi:V/A-type H+-transporting ATPase subunit I